VEKKTPNRDTEILRIKELCINKMEKEKERKHIV
jgi:hypothetical protein